MKRLILALLLLTFSPLHADDDSNIAITLMKSTFRIYGESKVPGQPAVTKAGTCFIVGKPTDESGTKHSAVLVTAGHVLEDITDDVATLDLRKKTDNEFSIYKHEIAIRKEGRPMWSRHPDKNVDLAVMRVTLPVDSYIKAYPTDFLSAGNSPQQIGMSPGDQLFTLGFPLGIQCDPAGFPILRSGTIASFPVLPVESYPTFFLDMMVFGGNSGGPVFYMENTRRSGTGQSSPILKLIVGLVTHHAHYEGEQLRIARVIHSAFIRELIESLPE